MNARCWRRRRLDSRVRACTHFVRVLFQLNAAHWLTTNAWLNVYALFRLCFDGCTISEKIREKTVAAAALLRINWSGFSAAQKWIYWSWTSPASLRISLDFIAHKIQQTRAVATHRIPISIFNVVLAAVATAVAAKRNANAFQEIKK